MFVIIVTYNGAKWIEKCLTSIINSSIQLDIIIIDNLSTDNTIDIIKENFSDVILIKSEANLGFAKANNIGIKYAMEQGADYVFLLNQDAWIEKDTIEKLLRIFEKYIDAGIVSPVHLNGSETALDHGFLDYLERHNTPCFVSDLFLNRLKECYDTKAVNAAAWLISRKCIEKVGGFDTSIFYHYGEDDNYSQRVIFHGFKIYIATTTTICHDRKDRKEGRSLKLEKQEGDILKCVYYANILENDKVIKKKFLINLIKKIIKLDFRPIFVQKKIAQNDLDYYLKIKHSREKNKRGGLVWLY